MLYYKTFTRNETDPWVVFIHGAGGSSSIWYKQLRAYREEFNILLVDLRGHGKSQNPPEKQYTKDYTFEDIARDVIEVLDDIGLEKANFVGVSLGTMVVRTIGEISPERVESMVFCGAVVRWSFRHKFFTSLGHTFKKIVPFMFLYKIFAWIIMPRKNHTESRNLFAQEAQRLARQEFLRWWKLTHQITPLLNRYQERALSIPTLYIMGGEDHMFLGAVRKLVAEHSFSRLSVVEKSGHVVNVEQPETFNQISIDFLQKGRFAIG